MIIEKIYLKNKPTKPEIDFGPKFGFESGWGNGYIGLPVSHPLHGVSYDEPEVYEPCEKYYPHGGWTYSEQFNPETQEDDSLWWLGFDTRHSGDNPTTCPESFVRELVDGLAKEYETVEVKIAELGF